MPRSVRKLSESGYYHLIARGSGGQILFVDKEDYLRFISLMRRFLTECGMTLCAYCLMNNHVHFLVRDSSGAMPHFMQKLTVGYSTFFNRKYNREGHLFQGRYKSEPIDCEDYLLTVFRYILTNPEKAGICKAADYAWSSYQLYGTKDSFVNTEVFQEMLGTPEEYAAYIAAKNEDRCMEFGSERHDDAWALRVIREELGMESGAGIQAMPWKERNAAIALLKGKGLTIRQIERLTGINRGVIQKVK